MFKKLVMLIVFSIVIVAYAAPVQASTQCSLYVEVEKGGEEPGGIYKMLSDDVYADMTQLWGFTYNYFQEWAPDGSMLMVAGDSKDDLDFYAMNDNPVGLTLIRDLPAHEKDDERKYSEFSISGDGKIAYVYSGQLHIGSVDSPDQDKVVTYFGPEYFLETFADNSQGETLIPPENDDRPQYITDLTWVEGKLYFFYRHEVQPYDLKQALLEYDPETGNTLWIDEDGWLYSPINALADGVGYIQKEDNFFDYMRYHTKSGGLWEVVSNYTQIWQPSWSPDEQQMAFVSNVDMGWNIMVYNRETTGIYERTFGGSTKDTPVWSPDGSIYVNYTFGGPREVARIDETGQVTVVSDFGTRVYVIGFKPGCDQ